LVDSTGHHARHRGPVPHHSYSRSHEREHEQVLRATRELEKNSDGRPTNEEISRRMDIPVEKVQKLKTISREPGFA
jgi:DNA-directed RNA polymerase sigma subunit (sigma70/sigma32)